MRTILVNPGAGPVQNATVENAETNICHFITDCKIEDLQYARVPQADADGRFGFLIFRANRCYLIQMPGLPLKNVRYISEKQDPFEFPRLYVDGNSWLWKFAILEENDFLEPSDVIITDEQVLALCKFLNERKEDIKESIEDFGILEPLLPLTRD